MDGFNEAEAIKPRNPDQAKILHGHRLASMRPRQSSLGIQEPSPQPPEVAKSFNEAEAIKPRNRKGWGNAIVDGAVLQ